MEPKKQENDKILNYPRIPKPELDNYAEPKDHGFLILGIIIVLVASAVLLGLYNR